MQWRSPPYVRGCRDSWVPAVRLTITITILCGTRAGQRFVVACGETLRFGRTAKADVMVADDPTMSALHFELENGDTAIVARDLESRNKLFLNGDPVTEAVLVDGDQLRAGRTYFSVSIADPLSPSIVPDAADETRAPGPHDMTRAVVRAPVSRAVPHAEPLPVATLFPGQLLGGSGTDAGTPGGFARDGSSEDGRGGAMAHLYAIVDGKLGFLFVEESQNAGRRAAGLAVAAASPVGDTAVPYLVEMPHENQFGAAGRTSDGWRPGILIESTADFDELLFHLRGIFSPRDTEGPLALFHIDQPQLLYEWLQRCSAFQLASFFGRISSVVLDVDGDGNLLRLTHVDERLLDAPFDADCR